MMMTKSPNDQDPPDYVAGDTPLAALYDKIYEKYPYLEDFEETLHNEVTASGEPIEGIHRMLEYVIHEAYAVGLDDAKSDMGEYIDVLEQEALGAVRMVLDAATEEGHELSDSEVCDAIDWDLLRKIDKKFGRRDAK